MSGDPGTGSSDTRAAGASQSLRNRKDAAASMQVPGGKPPLRASSPPPPGPGSHPLGGDAELRALARPWLEAQGQGRVLDEVGLEHGQVRVDLLLLGPEALHGLEVKSERDTLKRLPAQVHAYSEALDLCTLAVAEHHLAEAQALLPVWWGVLVATRRRGLHLLSIREPRPNPAPSPVACARLLWRQEVLAELRRAGVRGTIRGAGEHLRHRLAAMVPVAELRARVRAALMDRKGWR